MTNKFHATNAFEALLTETLVSGNVRCKLSTVQYILRKKCICHKGREKNKLKHEYGFVPID
jgi:hypothetical protein